MKKVLSYLFDFVIVLVIIFAVLITLISLNSNKNGISNIMGYIPLNIQTESMEKTINSGDLIIVKETKFDKLKENDIISFLSTEQDKTIIKTHRIIEIIEQENIKSLVTKGDNNEVKDDELVIESNFIGSYSKVRIPLLGACLTFLKTQIGFFLFIILPLFIVFVYQLYKFITTIMEEKKKELVEQIRKEEKLKIKNEDE